MTDRLDFSLTQLRYFVASAEIGNISDAAQSMHASQSAVSTAIQRLERQLGTQLLLRHRAKGIALTPSGRLLLEQARALLDQARHLQANSRTLQTDGHGRLDVGCCSALAPFLLPSLISNLRAEQPDLTVTVQEASSEQLRQMLRDGACEIAVSCDGPVPGVLFTELVRLPLRAFVADGHPLGRAGQARVSELSADPLVTDDPAPVPYGLDSLMAGSGAEMPAVVRTSNLSTTLGLVAAGVGFTVIPGRTDPMTTLDGGRVVPVTIVPRAPENFVLGLASMPDVRPSGRARAFAVTLVDTVRELYPTP